MRCTLLNLIVKDEIKLENPGLAGYDKSKNTKGKILKYFLLFWEEEALHCVIKGETKAFKVYLVV